MNFSDRYLTAIHESGHCVAALSFGCTIDHVNVKIDTEANRCGVCVFRPANGMTLVQKLMIDLAGAEATRHATMYRGKKHLDGIGSDVRSAAKLLHEHGAPDNSAILSEAKELCRRIIGESWGAVARIAQRLLSHGSVSGALAQAIFISHAHARRERQGA